MLKKETYKLGQNDSLIIDDVTIAPGTTTTVKLNIGKLPSGNNLTMFAHIFRSINPGPVMLITGGVHGDEINGIEIITDLLTAGTFTNLAAGTIIAIPLVNVFGFNNTSRDLPDGKDINRSFPGSTSGSMASRLARTLTKKILPMVDYSVDFHTGGAERYNFAQTRYSKIDPIAKSMAETFNAPFTIEQAPIAQSFRKVATEMGISCLLYEGGESIRINETAKRHGKLGLIRLMVSLGYLNETITNDDAKTVNILKTDWIRASEPGIFSWEKKSGESIKAGEILGVVKDPYGLKSYNVKSKADGYIIGHNNAAVVNQGDPLFHIGLI
jgi:uncharacterized protein